MSRKSDRRDAYIKYLEALSKQDWEAVSTLRTEAFIVNPEQDIVSVVNDIIPGEIPDAVLQAEVSSVQDTIRDYRDVSQITRSRESLLTVNTDEEMKEADSLFVYP